MPISTENSHVNSNPTEVTKEILTELRRGSHKAYERVFIVYYRKIKFFINGFIKSEETAEELTQEIFLKLWEKRGSIDLNKSFGFFLYTMARNSTFNFLKHKLVHESYIAKSSFDDSLALSPEEQIYAKEIDLLIAMSVKKMPDQRRRIYELSRQEGLSNDEIASKLNISKKTVENQLSIALKELRKVISLFMITICQFTDNLWNI
jgi:RNA polymerase sigma-70 factor, Bacteroides expansion family 1